MKHYVYLIRCRDNSLYCGQTTNIPKRIKEHNSDSKKASKYVRTRKPAHLVYFEPYKTIQEALKREYEIKKLSKQAKELLVMTTKNPARKK